MNNKTRLFTMIFTILFACSIMAIVDILWEPSYIIHSTVKLLLFLAIPLLYARITHDVSYTHLLKSTNKHLKSSALLGSLLFLLIIGAYFTIGRFFDFSAVEASLRHDLEVNRNTFVLLALYVSFVNSLLEEFFFRGFAFIELRRLSTKRFAMIFSASIFAVYHLSIIANWFSPLLFALVMISLFVGGLVFNQLNEHTGNIVASWMVHMFANFAINIVGFLLLL